MKTKTLKIVNCMQCPNCDTKLTKGFGYATDYFCKAANDQVIAGYVENDSEKPKDGKFPKFCPLEPRAEPDPIPVFSPEEHPRLRVTAGSQIGRVLDEALVRFRSDKRPFYFAFNDIEFFVDQHTTRADLEAKWRKK